MTETAKALGLERSHLYKKCQQLGVDLARCGRDGVSGVDPLVRGRPPRPVSSNSAEFRIT